MAAEIQTIPNFVEFYQIMFTADSQVWYIFLCEKQNSRKKANLHESQGRKATGLQHTLRQPGRP